LTVFATGFIVFRIVLPAIIFLYLCTIHYTAMWLIDYPVAKEYIKIHDFSSLSRSGRGLPGIGRGLPTRKDKLSRNPPLTLQQISKTVFFMRKSRQNITVKSVPVNSKVNPANIKVNGANTQSRPGGILFAPANGKLYFEFLKIFSVPENTCPCRGRKMLRSRIF
jgi:hypothetical protein